MNARRLLLAALLAVAPRVLAAQDRGAAALGDLIHGLGTTARVLVIAAHPDDEDTQLITWLARGRQVETAYLSLTRGDGGQNLIGNELGEGLGVIRTEELLAARRLDGGHQYFTRAYDFGFSKTAEETYLHWPRDSILGDIVRVIRSFRPHVIVAVFSGTPRDGHGHHQVSGILAREAYEIAGDTVRFPRTTFGSPWQVPKFYRGARFSVSDKTLQFDVGEYNPLLGRGYAELSGESRSQHKSQGFGVIQRKGEVLDMVRREASRVNALIEATTEKSIFDGIDTSWARFRGQAVDAPERTAIDELPAALTDVRRALDFFDPSTLLAPLDTVSRLLDVLCGSGSPRGACRSRDADLARSVQEQQRRVAELRGLAAGVLVEALVNRGTWAAGGDVPVAITVYNRGRRPIMLGEPYGTGNPEPAELKATTPLAPGEVRQLTARLHVQERTEPYWLRAPRFGDIFGVLPDVGGDDRHPPAGFVRVPLGDGGVVTTILAPVVNRFADPVRGEIQRPLVSAPAVALTLGASAEYAPANRTFVRGVRVTLRSAATDTQQVRLVITLPTGITADSTDRTITLPPGAERSVDVTLRGRLAPGRHIVRATASVGSQSFNAGYSVIDYDHIRPQYMYRPATLALQAVDVTLPSRSNIAYVQGVGDNVAPALAQLGFTVTIIDPAKLATTALADYAAVVVGPRAYESSADLVAQNGKLLDYAKNGGTVVVQYGQYEMARPGMLPFPITLGRPASRVTIEEAPVTVLDATNQLLTAPNKIRAGDFDGWVQERGLYMPSSFDVAWTPLLQMNDPNELPNQGGLLVAKYGRGTYVYTTLSLFRQLPAANPGAARLFVNLLAAGQTPRVTP